MVSTLSPSPMMAAENGASSSQSPPRTEVCMQKFRLYETQSNFYMIGRDESRTHWQVLKIGRLDSSELNIREDSTTYTERECSDLLGRIHEGNKATGGLKFVTFCYGIIGFIKFLGPYYMLLITKRKQIGVICGHNVYAVSKSEIIPLPNPTVCYRINNSKDENRYRKLLCTVDLTKDFFFSYSYNIMHSLQKNLCNNVTGQAIYENMFVWNEFLTRGIRSHMQNTLWTVALVHGFFKQATFTVSGREFMLTLIARRSRHYAGTRYLKRGVNKKGSVANDVETEQIAYEVVPDGFPVQTSSVVQNRGSIPLFWSQETSRLNLKPDILLSKENKNHEATRLHFDNLAQRYGNPIIILNLIKTQEKKPRESILRAEFANAIVHVNKNLSEENHLRFLHWDLSKHSRRKATNALLVLGKIASYALSLTGFFYCQVTPAITLGDSIRWPYSGDFENGDLPTQKSFKNNNDNKDVLGRKPSGSGSISGSHSFRPQKLQKGALRTNCIDCLDRTNVAQYAYGLAALGHQLYALGVIGKPKIELDAPLADELMGIYEKMGDTLAYQYGGSAAHNKIFSEIRGHWRAAIQLQEFLRSLQRYYSNAYTDTEKQNAINVLLGHFQLAPGKPALWELDSDQHCNMKNGHENIDDYGRSFGKRSLSDGNITRRNSSPTSFTNTKQDKFFNCEYPDQSGRDKNILAQSSPNISTPESDIALSSYTPLISHKQLFGDMQRDQFLESEHIFYTEHGEAIRCSNFVDLDWLCVEEPIERSSLPVNSPGMSLEKFADGTMGEITPCTWECDSTMKGMMQTDTELPYVNMQNSNGIQGYTDK